MKLNQLKSDESRVPVSDRDASLVERPVTEVHKDPPALILVKKPAGGKQSAGHGSKLKRQKEEAILALLTHRSIEEAARAARIGSATLVRWLKLEDFNTEYREARRAAFLQAIARLQQVASAAVSLLMKMIADPNAPAAVTIERHKKKPAFAATMERGRAKGRLSVRRNLFEQAAKGNSQSSRASLRGVGLAFI